MAKNEKTSKKVASKASKLLKDPKSSRDVKSVAGSALTQKHRDKKSGSDIRDGKIENPAPDKSKSQKKEILIDMSGKTRIKRK